uniref:Protein tyrosine phosphatase mitochondrial 1 n=2 Tax=Piliocolobus tephrosceles TaxID=591936 RepID=A0A8C9IYJ8_9PRIM
GRRKATSTQVPCSPWDQALTQVAPPFETLSLSTLLFRATLHTASSLSCFPFGGVHPHLRSLPPSLVEGWGECPSCPPPLGSHPFPRRKEVTGHRRGPQFPTLRGSHVSGPRRALPWPGSQFPAQVSSVPPPRPPGPPPEPRGPPRGLQASPAVTWCEPARGLVQLAALPRHRLLFSRVQTASAGADGLPLRRAGWRGMAATALLEAGLARVLFYPTLLYTLFRGKVPGRAHRDWYHRIDPTVLLGALPLRSLTRQLVQDENVRGVITMNEEYETRFLCHSSQVHRWSPEEAIRAIAKIRSYIHIRPGQLDVLKEFHKQVTGGAAKDGTFDTSKT